MSFSKQKSDAIAQELLKYDFEKMGRGEDNKIDCLGIIIRYMKEFGVQIPDYSHIKDWKEYDEEYVKAIPRLLRKLEPDEKLKIGDIIVFRNTQEITGNLNHAGIYLGKNDFIHAGVKFRVKVDKLYRKYWKEKVYGFFRLREEYAPAN